MIYDKMESASDLSRPGVWWVEDDILTLLILHEYQFYDSAFLFKQWENISCALRKKLHADNHKSRFDYYLGYETPK